MVKQRKLTQAGLEAIVRNVNFMDRVLWVGKMGHGFYIQVQYNEACVVTGKITRQKARKWYVSPFSTETEVIETCFKAVRTSMEHVVREHFTYRGRRVYSPHFHIDARIVLCDKNDFDTRVNP
jgi:hypothetical protein